MERGSLRIKTQDSVHTSTLEANAKKSICLTSVTNLKLKYSVTWKGGGWGSSSYLHTTYTCCTSKTNPFME